MQSSGVPLGLLVSRTAKTLSRAFDDALVAAGGSTSAWLVLLSLTTAGHGTRGERAEIVGVTQPTLSHHLDGLERGGYVAREGEPGNRRVQQVRLTPDGEALFLRLRRAAGAFDGRLRAGLDDGDVATLQRLLGQLVENASPD